MDAFAFLTTAQKLASQQAVTEPDKRTAISRWYYALMLSLIDRIARSDVGFALEAQRRRKPGARGSLHSLVIEYLKGTRFRPDGGENRTGRRVPWVEVYETLMRSREKADYDLSALELEIEREFQQWKINIDQLKPRVENL
jgi:hypothetical protein